MSTRARFPIERIGYRWSGQLIEPVDGLPAIGHNAISSHLHVATGYSGNGMTFSTLAGMILSDQILGRENKYSTCSATRITPVASAVDYVTENVDFPKYLVIRSAHAGRRRGRHVRIAPAGRGHLHGEREEGRHLPRQGRQRHPVVARLRTSDAMSGGTTPRPRGTVPAMARASGRTAA